MALTKKQIILAAIRGERLDKVPFGARIDLWYNYNSAHGTLPKKYKGWKQTDIIRDQGAGAQHRCREVVKEEYQDMEVIEKNEPPYVKTELRTPLGSVYSKIQLNPEEGPWIGYEIELPFKSEKDYPIIKYVLEHAIPVDNFAELNKVRDEVGEDGMVMPSGYSPAQRIMRQVMGYELFFNELMDHPTKVEELIELMKDLERKEYQIAVKSDQELFRVCGNWSDDIHTPVFKRYFIPWLQEITDFLHAHGKLAMVHIDGENKRLIPFLLDTHVDVWEALAPAPMTKVTIAEVRKALGDKATIWGGVPAILFEPTYSDEEFDNYVINLLKEIAPGYRFIVGMGDNLPFDGKIERVGRIVELIDKYGNLPINI
jgi:uroporphyrinogen-III decarboxylase